MKEKANIRNIWEHIGTMHGSSFLAVTHSVRHTSLPSLLQSIEDCRKWVTMWYMCTLSYPAFTSKHKLAKDGHLFKAVNFTLQQATKTKKECKDRYFFL
jgi:hypothetical protein